MFLKQINYKENIKNKNPWILKDVVLGPQNLIVGKNASGKSRTINVIDNIAKIIRQEIDYKEGGLLLDGEWSLHFTSYDGEQMDYNISIRKGIILEEIVWNDKKVLNRTKSETKIFSYIDSKYKSINPPEDKLVLHIRRDEKEHPFFEKVANWAESVSGLRFSGSKNEIRHLPNEGYLDSLGIVPDVIDKLSENMNKKTIADFNSLNYELEGIRSGQVPNFPPGYKLMEVKEDYMQHWISQIELSNGMFRSFALLVIINHFVEKKKSGLIMIDDLGEGLDYNRSYKLAEILFDNLKDYPNIQLIVTTNNHFLMNAIDIKLWNVLIRDKSEVRAYNYSNSRERFDKFLSTGLSNFDFFVSKYVKE